MPSIVRPPVLALGLVVIAVFSIPAQQRPQPPVFASGTEVVFVDFVVSDKTDRPVRGLSAKDFVVKEDGKERPIVSFEAFAGDERAAPPPSDTKAAPPSPPVRSLGAAAVLLVDDGQLTPTQAARLRPDLKVLLAKMGEHSGSMALVAPSSKVSVAGRLPGAAARVAAAVDSITGRRFEDHSTFPVSDAEAIAAARGDPQMLARLISRFMALNPSLSRDQAEALAHSRAIEVAYDARMRRELVYGVALLSLDWLAGQPGRHSLVIVSGGFARDPEDVRFNEIVTRSLRVNAPIHFLDVRGLQGMGRFQDVAFGPGLSRDADETPFAWSDAAEGSSGLADDTGGMTIRNTNDMGKGLGRLLDTMQTYYILGYEPPVHAKPGFHKIRVEVRTKSLIVRARRGYFDGAQAGR